MSIYGNNIMAITIATLLHIAPTQSDVLLMYIYSVSDAAGG